MRKKILRPMLLIACLLCSITASAYDYEVGGIYYNTSGDKTLSVTYKDSKYNSYTGNVTIPSSVDIGEDTYTVTSIGEYAFKSSRFLVSIVIPSSVTSIGDYAFSSGINLESIVIPSSVTSIGDFAF